VHCTALIDERVLVHLCLFVSICMTLQAQLLQSPPSADAALADYTSFGLDLSLTPELATA